MMYELRALLQKKVKPTTPTETLLLEIIKRFGRVIETREREEKLWGPAHQVVSESKKLLEQYEPGPDPTRATD